MVEIHDPDCGCARCVRAEAIARPWRCGSQVGRTIYVDVPGDKDPRWLIGLMDSPDLAAHVVEAHNALIDGNVGG
jgi:myo-inositol catabolism protein IolC